MLLSYKIGEMEFSYGWFDHRGRGRVPMIVPKMRVGSGWIAGGKKGKNPSPAGLGRAKWDFRSERAWPVKAWPVAERD